MTNFDFLLSSPDFAPFGEAETTTDILQNPRNLEPLKQLFMQHYFG